MNLVEEFRALIADYKAAIAERDARIAELTAELARVTHNVDVGSDAPRTANADRQKRFRDRRRAQRQGTTEAVSAE